LPKVVKDTYGLELDISGVVGNPWSPPDVIVVDRREVPRPLFRDVLFLALYQNNCQCREDGGKLILERLKK
jgi:hypothetical protein